MHLPNQHCVNTTIAPVAAHSDTGLLTATRSRCQNQSKLDYPTKIERVSDNGELKDLTGDCQCRDGECSRSFRSIIISTLNSMSETGKQPAKKRKSP